MLRSLFLEIAQGRLNVLEKGLNMKTIHRIILLVALLIAAIASYSQGISSGVFFFIALGLALEMLFWLKLFPNKK